MSASNNTAEARWEKVVQDYRQLFVLRRQGRREESARLLHHELPMSISAWSECDAADGPAKKQRLSEMFQQEQRRLDDVWFLQELMEQRLRTELLPALSERIGEEVRRAVNQSVARPTPVAPAARPARVVASDIPTIIDLLLRGEQQANAQPLAA